VETLFNSGKIQALSHICPLIESIDVQNLLLLVSSITGQDEFSLKLNHPPKLWENEPEILYSDIRYTISYSAEFRR